MPYTYTPLRADSRDIRILSLQPCRPKRRSGKTPPIRLRIETTTLDNAGEYTCLSYTWGAPSPKRSIKVNGHDFSVRANLFSVLRRLQLPDKPRRLWIDAICINQDSIPERDAQVAMMRHIFRQATDVIAWIGESNGLQDQRAIDFVRALSFRAQSLMVKQNREGFKPRQIDAETAAWIGSVTSWALVGSVWMDFVALIERPWFSRIWIVQEIIMAKKTTVWCGKHQLDWMEFFHCCAFVKEHCRLISSLAAPECLRYHDPAKQEVFFREKPVWRLFKAAEDIAAVGHLVSQHQLAMLYKEIVGQGWMASDAFRNRPSCAVWGELDTESRNLRLYFSDPLELDGSLLLARHDEGVCDERQEANTRVVNPHNVLRTLLHHPPGGRNLLAVTDNGIPIFEATGADGAANEILAGARTTKESAWTAYELDKSTLISGDRISKRSGWTMYDIVHRFRAFQATDPRDKVYALIGIAADVAHALGLLPRISYAPDTTILDVFWDLISFELRYRRGLGFLSNACGLNGPEGVPSWMPLWYDDVSGKSSTSMGLRNLERQPLVRYCADNDYADHGDSQPANLDKKSGMLYVHGFLLSEIMYLGDVFDRDLAEFDRHNTRREWATMLGVERIDKAHQVLSRLRRVGLLTAADASDRFTAYATDHAIDEAVIDRHSSFLGTLLASASDQGTQHLANQGPEYDDAVTANVPGRCPAVRDSRNSFENRILEVCHGRRLFISGWGHHRTRGHVEPNFGLCPADTQAGDLVVALYGSSTPQVIRKIGDDEEGNVYQLVGEAYVHSWMQGQMIPEEPTRPFLFRLR
ncbi:hypothetical protein OQA88_3446 [Cercophora sp. LCS_1]